MTSSPHAIFNIAHAEANTSDFNLVATGMNNCLLVSSLAAGANCTLYVRFTPNDIRTRAAKIVIIDDANTSPHTGCRSATGQ